MKTPWKFVGKIVEQSWSSRRSQGQQHQAEGIGFSKATYIHVFTNPGASTNMYMYIHHPPRRSAMAKTKLFKNGNSQAVRIPAELAYNNWDIELVIERDGDELRIRPARRRMGDVLGKLAQFSPDFLSEGRGLNIEGERDAL
jgi:antitoxin VapB